MRREASIPLFLWAASAILAHLIGSGGADQAARLIDERLDVSRFAAGIRSHVRGAAAPPVEIALEDEQSADEVKPDEKRSESESVQEAEEAEETPEPHPEQAKPPPKDKPKPDERKPDPKPEARQPDPPKPELAEPAAPAAELKPVPQLELPKKIAVQQNVENEQQEDNPNANFISDKANRVSEETRARITSTDQNDKKPTPGAAPNGPREEPGNAQETHVRQDNDQPGLQGFAPGGAQVADSARAAAGTPAAATDAAAAAAAPGTPGSQVAKPAQPAPAEASKRSQVAQAATRESPGAPETLASNDGSSSVNQAQAATPEQRARKVERRLPPRRPRSILEALGLGAAGLTPNGVALNLTPNLAAEAVGSDEMSRLRRADGERRRSQHRGSWVTPSFERYRSAIENYVPSVKPGNQTALNTAAVPFAAYLVQVHNRIHPIFADTFLSSLEQLPASHPLSNPSLMTSLEIVVDREEGRLVRRGVTRTSGITAFDINAIAAVDRAGPFGAPPAAIVSPDGNVYLHWEFRRDGMACSTLFAHPYLLKIQPKTAPLPDAPPLPPLRSPDDELPAPGERHGLKTSPAEPKPAAPPG